MPFGFGSDSSPSFSSSGIGAASSFGGDVSTPSWWSGLAGIFSSVGQTIALDYRAINSPTPSNVTALPGAGYFVNGQFVPSTSQGGFGNLTSSLPLLLIVGAILFFAIRRRE
jgi:hypothetical protein